jgi:hypothetical protein
MSREVRKMKRPTLIPRIAAFALALSGGMVLAQDATTAKISVNGMVCSLCAQGIEKR